MVGVDTGDEVPAGVVAGAIDAVFADVTVGITAFADAVGLLPAASAANERMAGRYAGVAISVETALAGVWVSATTEVESLACVRQKMIANTRALLTSRMPMSVAHGTGMRARLGTTSLALSWPVSVC